MSIDTLPVLLVSSASETVATPIILELIDNDVTEEYRNEIESLDRVWRLDNKYYRADVRVHVLTDGDMLTVNPNSVEAHIIHITEDEVSGQCVERAARRAGECGAAWQQCHVRLLLADCADHGPLDAWALAQHAAFVPRREPPEPPEAQADEPFADACGVERARAALHAHAWSNLRRKEARFRVPLPPLDGTVGETESGESSDSELAWRGAEEAGEERDEEEEEVRAVERAEAFALALGALAAERAPALGALAAERAPALGALAAERAPALGALAAERAPDAAPRLERLQRAEELVTAFCRALGLDPDSA